MFHSGFEPGVSFKYKLKDNWLVIKSIIFNAKKSEDNIKMNVKLRNNLRADLDRKCLLSFGAGPFVFQVAIQKFKDQDI